MQPSEVFKKSAFYRFGTNLFLVITFGAIVSGVVLYYILPKELPSTYTEALRVLLTLREKLYIKTYLIGLPIAGFIFAGVFALSMSFAKKIIIPLKSAADFSEKLKDGDFSQRPPISSDELSPLSQRLNDLVDSYQKRIGMLKEDMTRLEKIQGNIEDHLGNNSKKEIKDNLKELIGVTEHMDRILEKLRV
jgi:methyl-accepting chemotaxis protein